MSKRMEGNKVILKPGELVTLFRQYFVLFFAVFVFCFFILYFFEKDKKNGNENG